jgi:hypothetical protein
MSSQTKDRSQFLCTTYLPTLKRKEQSIYKPTDLWSSEDDILFLKFFPSKRDRCFHTISRDLSFRPHEILKLRIKDVVFKTAGDYQYAEVLINGKTGSRHIPLFNSIPYLKDWLDYGHPQRGNPNGILIPSLNHATLGKKTNEMINYVPWERIAKNYEFIEDAQMSNSIIVFQLIYLDIFYETCSLAINYCY